MPATTLQTFLNEVRQAVCHDDSELGREMVFQAFKTALKKTASGTDLTTIMQRSNQYLPTHQMLLELIPLIHKIPDEVVEIMFMESLQDNDFETTARLLCLIARHRYPLLEEISFKEDRLNEQKAIFNKLLKSAIVI